MTDAWWQERGVTFGPAVDGLDVDGLASAVEQIERLGRICGGSGIAGLRFWIMERMSIMKEQTWLDDVEALGRAKGLGGAGALRFVLLRILGGETAQVGDRAVCSVPWQYRTILEDAAYAAWAVKRARGLTGLSYGAWTVSQEGESG